MNFLMLPPKANPTQLANRHKLNLSLGEKLCLYLRTAKATKLQSKVTMMISHANEPQSSMWELLVTS